MRYKMGFKGCLTSFSFVLLGLFIGLLISQAIYSSSLSFTSTTLPERYPITVQPEVHVQSPDCPKCDPHNEQTSESQTKPHSKISITKDPYPSNSLSKRRQMYRKDPKSNERPQTIKDEYYTRKSLYIGVMTTKKFLNSRALVVNDTWGKYAPHIEYYTGEETSAEKVISPLSVVSLLGVTDVYPPFKKFFKMLTYIHDNHINDYNWFMRADDDAYVRVPELVSFLSQLDHSEPLYVGSPGTGRKEDLELIKLFKHEHFCMGGTGVIFSRELLIQLAPHLDYCMNKMSPSLHDDVEVGRCISRKLNLQCTWSYEMNNLFYNDYSNGKILKGKKLYRDKTIPSALTMHAFKTPQMMYKIHQFFTEIKLKNIDKEKRQVAEELKRIQSITNRKQPFP